MREKAEKRECFFSAFVYLGAVLRETLILHVPHSELANLSGQQNMLARLRHRGIGCLN